MDSLTQIEDQLKRAAESREYYAVDRLTLQYGDAARDVIAALPAGAPAIAATARRVLDTLEWARLVVLTGRASTAYELRRIPFLARYMSIPQAPPPAIRIDV
jgi:hypothetical protein